MCLLLGKAVARNIAYKWYLKLVKKPLITKNKVFGALLTYLPTFDCLSDDLLIGKFHANGLDLLSHA